MHIVGEDNVEPVEEGNEEKIVDDFRSEETVEQIKTKEVVKTSCSSSYDHRTRWELFFKSKHFSLVTKPAMYVPISYSSKTLSSIVCVPRSKYTMIFVYFFPHPIQ